MTQLTNTLLAGVAVTVVGGLVLDHLRQVRAAEARQAANALAIAEGAAGYEPATEQQQQLWEQSHGF